MSKLSEDIKNRKWEFYGAAALPLYITIYPPLYTDGFKGRYGLPVDIINAAQGRRVHWFMDGDQLSALAEKTIPILMKEGWAWYERCVQELAVFQEFNQRFLKMSLQSLSDAEVWSLMREYREHFYPPFVTNNVIEPISYYFQLHLKEMLVSEGLSVEKAGELIDQYGQAARPNYVKLCAEEYRKARSEEEREEVRQKYYYLYNDYLGVKEVTHKDLQKLVQSTPYVYAEERRTPDITPRAQQLLTFLQVVTTVQDVRKAELLEMVTAAKRFGEEYARRSGVPYEDIEWATWYEIEDNTVDIADLRARHGPFVMYWTLSGFTCVHGEEAKQLIKDTDTYILHTNPDAKEVKGVCASKGKVTGRAVIVFSSGEFDKVQPGDVLFTMMTRPEYLPVMHCAAAFICDEGGLTSHAAIVAREMKKPCIVGTRVGTRIFKDGDLVEVDAEQGVVRILKQA